MCYSKTSTAQLLRVNISLQFQILPKFDFKFQNFLCYVIGERRLLDQRYEGEGGT